MKASFKEKIFKNRSAQAPFALIFRPHINENKIEMFFGKTSSPRVLYSVPLEKSSFLKNFSEEMSFRKTLLFIPHSQIMERGFVCKDDDAKLVAMNVTDYREISVTDFLEVCPNESVNLSKSGFDISDNEYEEIVRKVMKDEIGSGEGSNFVIKRSFTADIDNYNMGKAFSIFSQLLQNEKGAYWTFLINTGDRVLIGASPELHVSLQDEIVTMNPISGTYRYPSSGPTLSGIIEFLSITKEADELYMVVEEELKMISNLCPQGGTIYGPRLKEMSRLAHTEYFIRGETTADPREVLRMTMFAPTVIGSPLENACRVISKYETGSRKYYGGVAAIISEDLKGNYDLDSTILIRTADINESGHVEIGVGATIVRHSNPAEEVAETMAKASTLMNAIGQVKELTSV